MVVDPTGVRPSSFPARAQNPGSYDKARILREVAGTGSVTVVDPHEVEFSCADALEANEPVTLINVRVHTLAAGDRYDLAARVATPAGASVDTKKT